MRHITDMQLNILFNFEMAEVKEACLIVNCVPPLPSFGRMCTISPDLVNPQLHLLQIMRNEHEFGGHALSLYHQYRERGYPVSIQLWSTEDGKQHVTFSCLPMEHLCSSTQPIPSNFSNLSPKTIQPQCHWQGTNAKKPAKYKTSSGFERVEAEKG